MNSALALVMAVGGGFFGTLTAITIAYFYIRHLVARHFNEWVVAAHLAGECPLCKRKIRHDDTPIPPPQDVLWPPA